MDTIARVNRWYDGVPETPRMFIVPSVLIAAGGINMAVTIARGFPFGLLFLVALAIIVAVRAPHAMRTRRLAMGIAGDMGGSASAGPVDFEGLEWLQHLNSRYETLPETTRFLLIPAVLIVAGGLNMALTIGHGFPFGMLFLIGLLLVVAFRAPFALGWLKPHAGPDPTTDPTTASRRAPVGVPPQIAAGDTRPNGVRVGEPSQTMPARDDAPHAEPPRPLPPTRQTPPV